MLSKVLLFATILAARSAAVPDRVGLDLEQRFNGSVRPFVESYCLSCHDKETAKADLDLSPYNTMSSVVRGYSSWQLVLEKLEAGDMPPAKAKKQPSQKERKDAIAWITALRKNEGQKHAGDPGPVLARRLSNAEYDYSIHDLTGVDLRPTREFPVDPANQAGFDNSGESLTMSPALLKKYYQAARQVADTLVLQPEGFTFAPHPMLVDTDRDKYSILRIVDFYQKQPTDFADYFMAAWRYQHRGALGFPQASLPEVAAQAGVSAKYLTTLWTALNDPKEKVGPLARVQSMFKAMPGPKADPAAVRAGAVQMRDWVLNVRDQLVPEVKNLSAAGMGAGSLPMVLWKDRQMAANHRRTDPALLKVGKPEALETPLVVSQVLTATGSNTANSASAILGGQKKLVARIVETPKEGAKLPNGIGTPSAPVARTAADGRTLSAVEVAELALAAQPVRKAGGPLPKTPDIVKFGGVFLEAPVITKGSSVTARMARAKKRGNTVSPELIVPENPAERAVYEAAFARFADIFPDAFYISERARVYLDAEAEESLEGRLLSAGMQNMTAYFRDDSPLFDMILDEAGQRELNRLWDNFNYNAAVPARMHLGYLSSEGGALRGPEFEQFRSENKYSATPEMIKKLAALSLARVQRNKPSDAVVSAVNEYFDRATTENSWLERTRTAVVPVHLAALQDFSERAFRRPLSPKERDDIGEFYRKSRAENGIDHEDAIRDSIVRILMSPYFCYRFDLSDAGSHTPAPAGKNRLELAGLPTATQPLSDIALASRLSYFLWSSIPDQELRACAAAGQLHHPEVLLAQTRRMLKDPRVRNFATEFAGHWLDFRRFEEHNAVDRGRFPSFDNELRQAMFEEPIRFLVDLIQQDRPVLNVLDGDYTFVNASLAQHYEIPGTFSNDTWTRVDNAGQFERGGLLPMAVFLTANSPGLRTSPVKRGYWVVRRVLGERIPPPPATVPDLPADEKGLGELTLRETLAKHRENQVCAGCHARFDSFGLVFEGYGAIGEKRSKDFGGRPVDTRAEFPGGTTAAGLSGLRDYIRSHRQRDFVDTLSGKILSYGLSRSLIISDDPLLAAMKDKLAAEHYRFGTLIETIVTSPQFLNKRGPAPAPATTAMKN